MVATILSYAVPVIKLILMLVIGKKIAGMIENPVKNALVKSGLDETIARFGGKAAKIAVLALVTIAALGVVGIDTASFAAVLAAAGFAVGLAFQGTLSNVAAGVMLLVMRPFKAGDAIKVAGAFGVVAEIGLFTTELDTLDNRRIILPNSAVFGATIENISHNGERRVDIDVGVGYEETVARTRGVLLQAVTTIPNVLTERGTQVIVLGLGGSSVDWQIRVWCDAANYWTVYEATIEAIKTHLDAANINIPYPQMDVHLDK